VTAERRVGVRTAAGRGPLPAGSPNGERGRRMMALLAGAARRGGGGRGGGGARRGSAVWGGWRGGVGAARGWGVTSLAPDDPGFMPTRYWRGPIWPIPNSAPQTALGRSGYHRPPPDARAGVSLL